MTDGKSILGLLTLGVSRNAKLEIEAIGDDAAMAVKAIEDYFCTGDCCVDDSVTCLNPYTGDAREGGDVRKVIRELRSQEANSGAHVQQEGTVPVQTVAGVDGGRYE